MTCSHVQERMQFVNTLYHLHQAISLLLCSFFLCIPWLSHLQHHVQGKYTLFSLLFLYQLLKKTFIKTCYSTFLYPQFGLPSCTWPFCLSALTFLLLTTGTERIFKLPLAKVTYPEKNLRFFWKLKKQEKMEKAEKERKEKEEQQRAIEEQVILNEKVQLRIELERMEQRNAENEAQEVRNDSTQVDVPQTLEGPGEERNGENDLIEDTLTAYV